MEKIKNICITVSIILLILLFFIYCTQINNPPYIKEYLDTQTLDKTLDTEKKMCDEGCYLAPINTQIININTRLDSLEKLNVLQDTKINNNIVNLTAMEDKIKKTEDELNKAMSPQK